jgi:hypothetical protein
LKAPSMSRLRLFRSRCTMPDVCKGVHTAAACVQ